MSESMTDKSDDLVGQMRGRARFCRDRGEIKTPELLDDAADALEAKDAEIAELRKALIHIDALCPVETGGMTDAALAGLLFNIENHARQALKAERN